MANAVQIVFEIDRDQAGIRNLRRIDSGINQLGKTAQSTSSNVNSMLNLFRSALIIEFFRRGADAALGFAKQAIDAFNQTERAALGLASAAQFKGISPQAAQEAVQGLDIVRNGLISMTQASQALQNLLLRGFSLEQSVQLIQAFGDSAAFNRQAALSFGDAVVSTSEGIKNLNSILSDNGGITKNLSVILRERGFEMQDLDDKVKGAAAREALYAGLVAETAAQTGNAGKLANTFAGQQAKLEVEQRKLLATLGETIAKNPELLSAFAAMIETLTDLTAKLGDSDSELRKFIDNSLTQLGALGQTVTTLTGTFEGLLRIQRQLREISIIGNTGGASLLFGGDSDSPQQVEATRRRFQQLREEFLKGQQTARPLSTNLLDPAKQLREEEAIRASAQKTIVEVDKQIEGYAKLRREGADTIAELQARLSQNPLELLFFNANRSQQEFLTRFAELPDKMRESIQRAQGELSRLELFRGLLGQGQGISNLRLQLAELNAGGDPARLSQARRQAIDEEIAQARRLQQLATTPQQRALINQRLIEATSNIGELTADQAAARREALQSQLIVETQLFEENLRRLSDQTEATKQNTAALREMGNRLAVVEGALTNFARQPIAIVVEDESGSVASVDLGSVAPQT